MELLKHLNNILPERTHILIAISSGLDSMVLLDILQYTKLYISVIHVNFQLRLKDSIKDEYFIQDFCRYKKIPFYKKRFNTKNNKKRSIQMTARQLRYSWFFKILKNIDASYIVLAHHLDDTIETFFINLFRSSSLRGLISISERSQYLLRPFLPFTKTNILRYAKYNNLWWREDISNKDSKFLRNSIRNDLISQFYCKNSKTLFFLKNDYTLIQQSIHNIFKIITINFVKKTFCWNINISKLKKIKPLNVYIYKLFSPYGFCKIKDIENFLYANTGKHISSKRYKLLNNRNRLIISGNKKNKYKNYDIFFEVKDFMDQKAFISIDFDEICFPVFLIHWETVNILLLKKIKNKKISKLFKEYKLSFFEKNEICILVNADNKIIWIINFGLNMLFKITLKTNMILNIY